MIRHHALVALAALLLSCSSSGAPATPAAPAAPTTPAAPPVAKLPPAPPFAPTTDLVQRADLAALVDALAAERAVESSHIGAAGAPSAIYARWEAVQKAATAEELRALLRHQSPVVRGYVAQHLVRDQTPLASDPLRPLLSDATSVGTTQGCMIGTYTVAALVLEELCFNAKDKEGARALVQEAAASGSDEVAAQAKRCLPKP